MAGQKGRSGGPGRGQGRKTKADEDKVRNLAISAITKKYGSEEKGMMALINSGEPSLIKFVYEHAFGKPKERHEHSGNPDYPVLFTLDPRFGT